MKYLVHCDQPNCYMHMTVNSEQEQADYLANHRCPYWGGESKVSWSVTKTLVEKMWELLDREMDELKGKWSDGEWKVPRPIDPEYHKHRARAFSESLAIFMQPFFTTADDIAREAVKRWEARRDSNDEYETPGIGHRRYEAAAQQHLSATPGWYGTAQDGYTADPTRAGSPSSNRGRGASVAARSGDSRAITEADASAMKAGYEAMPTVFTPAVLAKQYGYSESSVKTLLGA